MNKEKLIEAIADIFCNNVAEKSIFLQMGKSVGKEWAKLVSATGLNGYTERKDVIKFLKKNL